MMLSLMLTIRLASVPGKVNSVFELLLMFYRNFFCQKYVECK